MKGSSSSLSVLKILCVHALIRISSRASSSSTSLAKCYVPLIIAHIMNICCITNSLHPEASFNGAYIIATKGQARYVFNKIATKTSLACMQRIFSTDNEEDEPFIMAFSLRMCTSKLRCLLIWKPFQAHEILTINTIQRITTHSKSL